MSAPLLFDKKSYLMTYGFSDTEISGMNDQIKGLGLSIISATDWADLSKKLDAMKHCVGVFLRPQNPSETQQCKTLIEYCQKNWIELRLFSSDPSFDQKLRVEPNHQSELYLKTFLEEIFPEKFQELGFFAVNQIIGNMIPDLKVEWRKQIQNQDLSEKKTYDFLIFCETNAVGFSGGITIKSNYDFLRSKSPTLSLNDDEMLTKYFAEIGNQVLGLINFNLKKLNIEARIGLPIMIGKDGMAHYRRRSAFYMPSNSYVSQEGGIIVSIHFLVPFLRGATISRDFNFEVQNADESEALEVL